MKTSLLRALAVCVAFAALPTLAQEPGPSRLEESRAFVEAQNVADLFEAIDDDNIAVRHRNSRLVCRFYGGETTRRLVTFSGQPRGDDVGCITDREHQAITLYATRYTPAITPEQAMADAIAGIRHRFADARPTPTLLHMTSEGLPTPLVQHFLITLNGEQWITSVFVVQSGEWIIKLRYTARALDEAALMPAQLEANAVIMGALLDIAP
jgi:hypothetical protein